MLLEINIWSFSFDSVWVAILFLLLGFAILIKGADLLVDGASSAAKKFGVSNLAIGLTVVAFGTSMPELIVSFLSALDGKPDASYGNVIGSNTFNLLFILGISGLIYPLVVQRNTVKYEVPLSLLAALVLLVLVNDGNLWGDASLAGKGYDGILGRIDSIILLIFFCAFLYYVYLTMKNSNEMGEGPSIKIFPMGVSIIMILIGLLMLIFGGKTVVDSAIGIAQSFGLSEKLIGLTILAAGTSLPELATSAVAAYRKNTDIAIGNVVGSNIFNIFFILGLTGLVSPIPYHSIMNFDIYVLLGSTVLLMIFMFTLNTRKLDRWEAFLMLLLYIVYTVYLVGNDVPQPVPAP